jgi:transcriptional regulator with XRE-family HTH domain
MKDTFSSLLRRAILESGMTRYAIAVKCEVDQAALSRFVTGKSSLNLATVDKLVDGLGIEVKLPQRRKDR